MTTQHIWNANQVTLDQNPGTLPNMSGTLTDYFQSITFTKIVKTTVDFQLVEVENPITFQGVVQPFKARELSMKPEGQRKWKWQTIHALPGVPLSVDDVVVYGGLRYRIMQSNDYSRYGYVEYHAVEDYTG